jgi:hypothetical protein
MVRISARTSVCTGERPVQRPLFHLQSHRKPWRCHARTVAGCTMISARRHSVHTRESQIQKTRSARESRGRARRDRSRTWICCRKASTSSCSARRSKRDPERRNERHDNRDHLGTAYSEMVPTRAARTDSEFSVGTPKQGRRHRIALGDVGSLVPGEPRRLTGYGSCSRSVALIGSRRASSDTIDHHCWAVLFISGYLQWFHGVPWMWRMWKRRLDSHS